jgi:hypothetical protein
MTTTAKINDMTNATTEMGLTEREIKLIALEAEGVDAYSPNLMEDFSVRALQLIMKASGDPSYVIRRCYYLRNGFKLA